MEGRLTLYRSRSASPTYSKCCIVFFHERDRLVGLFIDRLDICFSCTEPAGIVSPPHKFMERHADNCRNTRERGDPRIIRVVPIFGFYNAIVSPGSALR